MSNNAQSDVAVNLTIDTLTDDGGIMSQESAAPLTSPNSTAPNANSRSYPALTPEEANEKLIAAGVRASVGPRIANVVATFSVDCMLDLYHIAQHARNVDYKPKRFAAATIRIRDPKSTALIFKTGKVVVTGAQSPDDNRLASRKYVRILQKLGYGVKFKDWKLQNLVGHCDMGHPVQLEAIAHQHHKFACYEPEIFSGLVYKMMKPKVTLLIFHSGKFIITGARNIEEIKWAVAEWYPLLARQYRK